MPCKFNWGIRPSRNRSVVRIRFGVDNTLWYASNPFLDTHCQGFQMSKPALYAIAAISIALGLQASPAPAHYLWIAVDQQTGEHGTANIFFEEGPAAGDGKYLDPFVERGTTWFRAGDSAKPRALKTTETSESGKRWLSAALPELSPRSIESYGLWGVYRYGETDVLLHYYARYVDVRNHDDLHELARAEQLALDIVPHTAPDGAIELRVLWNGKPAASRKIFVRGPNRFQQTLTTDDKGTASFQAEHKGQYLIRTNVDESDRSGVFEGKDYQLVRHHATLNLRLPVD